ncbi:MAG: hypothetical protein NTW14_09655 [bacterium]|nr:hypothetical protein [bacterium]
MKSQNRLFRIKTKGYLGEHSEEYFDDIRAATREEALAKFYKRKRLKEDPSDTNTWNNARTHC